MNEEIKKMIRDLPFKVRALAEKITDPGSYERELAMCVYKAQKADVEYVVKELERTITGDET